MRKSYQTWLAGALACAMMVPFTGCSSDDDPSPVPAGNGEEIKAEFTVSFNKGNTNTKATADEVGDGNSFHGMDKIKLLAYRVTTDDKKVEAGDQLVSAIDLAKINASEFASQTQFMKSYKITLKPEKVDFLFYGESAYSPAVGKLTATYPTLNETANTANFKLSPITTVESKSMTDYLTTVVKAACANVDANKGGQQLLKNFFDNATSAGFSQIAYMLAQLYCWDATNFTSGGQQKVKDAINASGNPVFDNLTTEATVNDVYAKRKKDERYLGKDFPIGGKTLKITSDFASGNNGVNVQLLDNGNTYNYPTSLYYMANSYPVAYSNQTAANWGNLGATFVNLSTMPTTPIALKDQINYAVGSMDLTLKVAAGGVTGNTSLTPDDNTKITDQELELLGVIVNKQSNVDWEFNAPTGDNSTSSAYDCAGVTAKKHKMLLLPTKENETVNVILELKNNSKHGFLGLNSGYIPAGATFYLAASLDPTKVSNTTGVTTPSVFMKDYKTVVNLTLNSLKSATQTIPDLGSSNIEFALSVDLSWKNGLTFDQTIN